MLVVEVAVVVGKRTARGSHLDVLREAAQSVDVFLREVVELPVRLRRRRLHHRRGKGEVSKRRGV